MKSHFSPIHNMLTVSEAIMKKMKKQTVQG